ncbi:hypothetical protein Cni_G24968 [Canna indica]|uniref:Agenet domain-containing protein n=1 Tax=Canna indica TaxID=4628 RepID=A0AAQ3QP13_9LILI|nr:hypothetical protein Cni_G24968 [Canna indica]
MSMNVDSGLLFKVGEVVESKSFALGYRSAWFRCKIKSISNRKGQIWYAMEFFDFPDEKIRWTKLYQKALLLPNRTCSKGTMELMVRPAFPPFFRKSQQPELLPKSDVIAIANDSWKIGDLVDWWFDSCYWSGRISQLLENDQVLIDLPDPPIGEGHSYTACSDDLRPSLDWTPENGWTVPLPKEHDNLCSSVELIRNNSNDIQPNMPPKISLELTTKWTADTMDTSMAIQCHGLLEEIPNPSFSCSPLSSERSMPPTKALSREDRAGLLDDLQDTHLSGNDHTTSAGDAVSNGCEISRDFLEYLENIWSNQISRDLTSLEYPGSIESSIESSIIRLQMLSRKIKWLRDMLNLDFECSNAVKSSWKFVVNCASREYIRH